MRYTRLDIAGIRARRGGGVAKRTKKTKKGKRTAPAKLVTRTKVSEAKSAPKDRKPKAAVAPVAPDVQPPADGAETALARVTQLEADRTNLMAQVAWARGVAQEQQKALEIERQRAEKLAADLDAQRARVERLKALSVFDRLLGRHKAI